MERLDKVVDWRKAHWDVPGQLETRGMVGRRDTFIPYATEEKSILQYAKQSCCVAGTTCVWRRKQHAHEGEKVWGKQCLSPAPGCLRSLAVRLLSHAAGVGRERILEVWVKVALEKETAQWPTSVLRSLKVRLIHPGFHGHIRSCHLALKECGNLSVLSGLALLWHSWGLATWLTCKHRSWLWQGWGYPDQHMGALAQKPTLAMHWAHGAWVGLHLTLDREGRWE